MNTDYNCCLFMLFHQEVSHLGLAILFLRNVCGQIFHSFTGPISGVFLVKYCKNVSLLAL